MSYTKYDRFIRAANDIIAAIVFCENAHFDTSSSTNGLVRSGLIPVLVQSFLKLEKDVDRCDALGFMAMTAEQLGQSGMPKTSVILRRLYDVFLDQRNAIQESVQDEDCEAGEKFRPFF